MNDRQSVAMDWRTLVANSTPAAASMAQRMAVKAADLAQREDSALTSAFAGNDRALAAGIALCGIAAVRPLEQTFHPHLARALDALVDQDRRDSQLAQGLVNFALLAECMGSRRPDGFDSGLLKPLVAARRNFDDRQRRSMAFSALALGDGATALALIDAKTAVYDRPTLRFEFNQFELIRYLAAVLAARRPPDWVEPAWLEYFELFPMHMAAQAAVWPDLFNLARVLANVRGDRVDTIADDIHARVMYAANSQA